MPENRAQWMPVRTVSCLSIAVLVSGCAATASVEPAVEADNPACAEVILQLPEEIAEYERRPTDSQATAVWGDPSAAVLRCGVEPPGPTTEICVRPYGVDWIELPPQEYDGEAAAEEGLGTWQYVTYGREPAVEIYLDADVMPSSTLLAELDAPVEQIDQTAECLDVEDYDDVETAEVDVIEEDGG